MTFTYLYKDTVFKMCQNRSAKNRISSYTITSIVSHGETIEIPAKVNGIPVLYVCFPRPYGEIKSYSYKYDGIRSMAVPNKIKFSAVYNLNFPDLEHIEFIGGNSRYIFSGGMLYSYSSDKLIFSLGAGMKNDTVIVPSAVEIIGSDAFSYTMCRDIIFHNRNIRYEGDPFYHSAWTSRHRRQQKNMYVGSSLYRVYSSEELLITPNIDHIDPKAFTECVPEEITVHTLQQLNELSAMPNEGVTSLTVATDAYPIPLSPLNQWSNLKHLSIMANSHYTERDGIVYNAAGDVLLFYPQNRSTSKLIIPEGTRIIMHHAFREQKHLEEVVIPGTVKIIEPGAFYACRSLRTVHLSEGVERLSDATVYEKEGVFESCEALEEVHFPDTLIYIGNRAFYGTYSLHDISFPRNIHMIGDCSFYGCSIQTLDLPISIDHIGPGAFAELRCEGVITVHAYRGTAHGLITALEDTHSGDPEGHITWRSLHIIPRSADDRDLRALRIPSSFDPANGALLSHIWDEDRLDEVWDEDIFIHIKSESEKMAYALEYARRVYIDEDTSIIRAYLEAKAVDISSRMIQEKDEQSLIDFIKMGLASRDQLGVIQSQCNNSGFHTASAYALSMVGTENKNSGNRLIQI